MADRAEATPGVREHFSPASSSPSSDRRVGYRTESQQQANGAALRAYLAEELQPAFAGSTSPPG